ncbi:EAL domain-containing response regulator [Arhodomonas sp. SL1]|uniref:EAL domain-containing response regulator n=1 Tax=Arhodomonas sp. SL1 TaxID=3425691 RepID=UPI003F8817AA
MNPGDAHADGRILILDDDPQVGQTVAWMAENLGMQSRATTNPTRFFELLEEWPPSHIVLDLVMPAMDGVEIMRHLAGRHCQARIIISSGVGTRVLDAARRAAAEHALPVAGVLPKPFTTDKLEDLLHRGTELAAGETVAASHLPPEIPPAWIEQALKTREIEVAYQPKVACGDGSVMGFEVLARWHHPQHGVIPPDRFVPVAEANGLIRSLTERVLESSLIWMAGRDAVESRVTPLTLAVNLSARCLDDVTFADHLAGQCRDHGIEPERVTLELTETAAMEDTVTALDLLTRLRMKGFHLAIDDFGTGYSSMVQLTRLPFSELKIDKSFTIAATASEEARTIVRSTIDLSRSLGLEAVAEGVEDAATLELLQELRCDMAQGYYIAPPMPPDAIADWLTAWRQQ